MNSKTNKTKTHLKELTENDYTFLTSRTGLSKNEIKETYDQFMKNNPDGKLNKTEFSNLMKRLEPNASNESDKLYAFVFKAFDSDKNGFVDFYEFMIAYVMSSGNDQKAKFEYAFNMYDTDNNGYLEVSEVKDILDSLTNLFDAEERDIDKSDLRKMAKVICKEMDKNGDGKITKDEFIKTLISNQDLAEMMSIF